MKDMKIGIGFVTGRKGFRHLFRTYVNNWNEYRLIEDPSVVLKLFVAYDLHYFGTTASDYKRLDPELMGKLDGISHFGATHIDEERRLLIREGVLDSTESEMLFGKGYGKKRNAVVWFALRAGMDRLLFIDDDEYPMAVQRGDPVRWCGQSVLGSHILASENADITHGRHCGYISPIPRIDFDDTLTEDRYARFIDALSNDILSWDKIKRVVMGDGGVTYADPSCIGSTSAEEVPEINGMKFISGANLCLNLLRGGADAPFFNPPNARGEDTFLSTCLSDKKVVRVPAYTFHDGFLRYPSLLHGVLPKRLEPVDARSPDTVERFARAVIGWVRYKPLLVYVTRRRDFESTIASMEATFEQVAPCLGSYFRTSEFNRLVPELRRYAKKAAEHYELFERTKSAWSKAVRWARSNPSADNLSR